MSKVETPLVLVNFKTYAEGTGRKAIALAESAEKVSTATGICFAVAPQPTDLSMVVNSVNIPVFAQHIDPIMPGSHTGHILPDEIPEAVAQYVNEQVEIGKKDGGFVFQQVHNIMAYVPPENIVAMFDAVNERT